MLPIFQFFFLHRSAIVRTYIRHPRSSRLLSRRRVGSAGYVTTIHLFSGDTINQNKLGWERENRLPTPREAARRSRSAVPKFLRRRVCICRVCSGRIRAYIRTHDLMCASPCVYYSEYAPDTNDVARPSGSFSLSCWSSTVVLACISVNLVQSASDAASRSKPSDPDSSSSRSPLTFHTGFLKIEILNHHFRSYRVLAIYSFNIRDLTIPSFRRKKLYRNVLSRVDVVHSRFASRVKH